MSYDSYLVRLDPQDDGGVAYIQLLGGHVADYNVKLLSPSEQTQLRDILLADNELGKTVGVNGIHGEGYVVLNTFPRMRQLRQFFNSLSNGYTQRDFFNMVIKMRSAAAVSKAEGGYRRRSSKRALRKKTRISRQH